ncbi:Extradiol ring-cleavage dioxygenase, class III enzyme, subunit B [Aspergillus karnatakaensis]|uniref:DODA-type extradiol aromatic ring-opening family dioxygenase n=1 Tax=Aspergillus karnatakaensis TaxID=1810916 RepID=UPI003CCCEDCD
MSSTANHRDTETQRPSTILISFITLVVAILIAGIFGYTASAPQAEYTSANLFGLKRLAQTSWAAIGSRRSLNSVPETVQKTPATEGINMRTPVYFLSHGGPNIMYDTEHPAYKELGKIGKEITTKVKPRAVVVFSAHWQAGRDTVQVNTAEMTELIYDFYGFPSHYYEEKYPNVGSREVANKVLDAFKEAGINAEGVKRGLDHGVWASFKCAFEPKSNPLNVPIVQVSLFGTEDPMQHYRLGQAVSKLREENILIIVSGMAVHNLRDLRFTFSDPKPMPYTVSFDEALKDAATKPPTERAQALIDLLKRGDARQAHPSFEHLLPIHIGAGAAEDDVGKRLFTLKEGSLSWAQYRFGEVGNVSAL